MHVYQNTYLKGYDINMKKFIKITAAASAALLLAKGLDNRLETSYYEISSPKLPKDFNNFKIAHISDYHNNPVHGLNKAIRREKPDIVVMTGDMTHDEPDSYIPAMELIQNLVKIAPCFIISGNHDIWRSDYEKFVAECKNVGAHFLRNETIDIVRNSSKIQICGMEDVFTKTKMKQTVKKYLDFFPQSDEYRILLFHRANALDFIKTHGFDLILSGHMHGGQIRIPGLGGILSPRSGITESEHLFFPKYFGGLYSFDSCNMIVNRGLGNPMPIPRFFNRPELGIITLTKNSAQINPILDN